MDEHDAERDDGGEKREKEISLDALESGQSQAKIIQRAWTGDEQLSSLWAQSEHLFDHDFRLDEFMVEIGRIPVQNETGDPEKEGIDEEEMLLIEADRVAQGQDVETCQCKQCSKHDGTMRSEVRIQLKGGIDEGFENHFGLVNSGQGLVMISEDLNQVTVKAFDHLGHQRGQ